MKPLARGVVGGSCADLHGWAALAALLLVGAAIACGDAGRQSRDETTSRVAASSGVAEIAYERCFFDAYVTEAWACELTVTTADGSSTWSFGNGTAPAFSPGGSRIAFVRDTGISVLSLADGTIADLGTGSAPAWSPDGTRIAFPNDPTGTGSDLYLMNSDGTNVARVTTNVGFRGDPDWSPSGRIAFDCEVESGNMDVCAIAPDVSALTRLTTNPAIDHGGRWSPDGGRIGFVTTRFGAQDIGVMSGQGGEAAGVTQLTSGGSVEGLDWSAEVTRMVFSISAEGGTCCSGACDAWQFSWCGNVGAIEVMSSDGTGVTSLATGHHPSWSPAGASGPGVTIPVPAAPSGLQASVVSAGQIDLTWTDSSTDEQGFAVQRSFDPEFTSYVYWQVGANVTHSSDTTALQPGPRTTTGWSRTTSGEARRPPTWRRRRPPRRPSLPHRRTSSRRRPMRARHHRP